ncbi:MAG TPA: Na+/H+ antiporter NhaA [Steroidobacteraceae bacterium]|nr:Na+/H+ antiporter NhaA [Steroidobacteraceae bacterium]
MAERDFQQTESLGGLVMLAAAATALVLANSPWGELYETALGLRFEISLAEWRLGKPILLWINDGLMAVFFLLVGLEIKREMLQGELSTPAKVALPVAAAIGGMAAPALIYVTVNWHDPLALRGWAIPSATDIAFALAALSLLGRGTPLALKLFLATVAIVDDIGAIAIIALFYTEDLSWPMLLAAGIGVGVLAILNVAGVTRLGAYVLVGIVLWTCVLKSGVHATLAGVVTAFAIPFRAPQGQASPGHRLEDALHPWVAFGILPLFALANAGVSFAGASFGALLQPIPLGIILGLVAGKTLGIFLTSWLAIRLRLATLPSGVRWSEMFGVAALCGIGFTMSFFIGTLAFAYQPAELNDSVKMGVLAGSILSALGGSLILKLASARSGARH